MAAHFNRVVMFCNVFVTIALREGILGQNDISIHNLDKMALICMYIFYYEIYVG